MSHIRVAVYWAIGTSIFIGGLIVILWHITDTQPRKRVPASARHKLLVFSTEKCHPCKVLMGFLTHPKVTEILKKDYEVIEYHFATFEEIDADPLFRHYCPDWQGVPWWCVTDQEGEMLTNSDEGDFKQMIERTHQNLSPRDIRKLFEQYERQYQKAKPPKSLGGFLLCYTHHNEN